VDVLSVLRVRPVGVWTTDTFPIVKRRDEAAHGSYRTKDTILQMYDQMQTATDTGQPYRTWLTPPPGPPADAEGRVRAGVLVRGVPGERVRRRYRGFVRRLR
jgi:hypothetical protein